LLLESILLVAVDVFDTWRNLHLFECISDFQVKVKVGDKALRTLGKPGRLEELLCSQDMPTIVEEEAELTSAVKGEVLLDL
jgi:hypothetical protein